MNQHRKYMIIRKGCALRGVLVKQPGYGKPKVGYDLSGTRRKALGL